MTTVSNFEGMKAGQSDRLTMPPQAELKYRQDPVWISQVEISTLTSANGSATVRFTREGAVLFNAQGCTTDLMENQQKLEEQILALYEKGQWTIDNVELSPNSFVRKQCCSNSRRKRCCYRSSRRRAAPAAAVSQDLRVAKSHNMSTQVIAVGGLTPLFRARGIRKRTPAENVCHDPEQRATGNCAKYSILHGGSGL